MRPLSILGSLTAPTMHGQMGDGVWAGDGASVWGSGGCSGSRYWCLVTAAVWRLLQGGRGGPSSRGSDESPLQILERRYARGEIDRDEYEEKKRDVGYS